VQTFLQVIYFYNPFVWLANIIVRRIREQAVDEMVLVALGAEAKSYSNTLIDIAEMAFWKANLSLRLVGVVESKKALQRRIKHMLTRPIPKTAKVGIFGTIVIIIVAAILLPMARAERSNKNATVTPQATGAGATEKAPPTGGSDTIVDPNTGIKFVLSKTIAGANDVIEHHNRITMSANGKFLLWWGQVVPLDGSPAFTLEELKGAGIASWSPDGQKIAFNSEGIEVLPVSPETGRPTGAVRKLLEETERWFGGKIYWSADSERILFVKWNRRMEREAGTINLRDCRLNKQPDYADFGLLSPDGKTIAYSMPQDGIWTRPVNGGAPQIARARSGGWLFDDAVVWTSDSQWVASAVGGWMRQEIHFARLSDGQKFDLFPPEAAGAFVGKSTDGKKLYFYRSSFDLGTTPKVVPVSGGSAFNVDPSVGLDDIEDRSWSSDSTSLAVLGTDREGNQHLWSIALTGGDRVRFNIESLGKDEPWLWSLCPDSRKLLYAVRPGTDQGIKALDFYVVPISLKDGRATGPATLVFKGWQFPNPVVPEEVGAWSPDGTKIAMPHESDQGNGYLVLFADGSKPMQIAQTPDKVGQYPHWSPDSKMIAFYLRASDREMLQVIPAAGGIAKTILTMPKGQSAPFGWSPDSKEVVVAFDGTISGFPITGGSARLIVRLQDAGYEDISWLGWSPDGQRLAFYGGKKGEASRLCLFSPSTGKITELENSPHTAWSFGWSPDSKMICCGAEEAEKARPAGVLRELDVAEAVQKAPPVAEKKPTEATTTPQVEPIAGPVFTDNFDNGPSKHWRFQDLLDEVGGPGRHAVENGELMLSCARACLWGIDWTDYVVTVRVCMKESAASGVGNLGIEARATPSQFGSTRRDRYSLAIFCNNNAPEYLWLGINYADASDTLRHGTLSQSPCSLVRDKWYTLEFEIRGQHLRGYLDGKLMVEATDARLSKGGPLWIGTYRSRALFDDFSVRQLP
jgi:Tol biopolymer transport system component